MIPIIGDFTIFDLSQKGRVHTSSGAQEPAVAFPNEPMHANRCGSAWQRN